MKRLFRKPEIYITQLIAILLMLLIVALMLISYTYAPKTNYAMVKVILFIIFFVWIVYNLSIFI